MINDAVWVDLNGDGKKSLVLTGEWMEITILDRDEATFNASTVPHSSGWWKSVDHMDYDNDGDQDLIMGNMGLNSKIKASEHEPLNLYLEDFDQNGKLDAIMTTTTSGKETIFPSGVMLKRQIPSIGSSLPANLIFDEASPTDLFGEEFSRAKKIQVVELRSGVFINDGNGFHFEPFPNLMQISFIRDFLIDDFTNNGLPDILSVGNLYASSMQEGRYAACRGTLMTGLPEYPQVLANRKTGISIKGDSRRVANLKFQGQDLLMVAINGDSIMWFKHR